MNNAIPELARRVFLISSLFGISSCAEPQSRKVSSDETKGKKAKIGYMVFKTDIDKQSRDYFIQNIDKFVSDGCDQINIGFITTGGNFNEGADMANYMQKVNSEKGVIFYAYNMEYVDSMGCYVFLTAQKRFSAPNGTFLFHAAADLVANEKLNADDLQEMLNSLNKINAQLLSLIKRSTSMQDGEAQTLIRRQVVLYSKDARRDGIIDEIAEYEVPNGTSVNVIKNTNDQSDAPIKWI